jgi:small subunit ribosomal protein S19
MDDKMAKVFSYKGYSFEDLSKMSLDELAKILPSRRRRSLKRGFTAGQKNLLKAVRANKEGKLIRTHIRDMIILPEFVGKKFAIHDGKDWNVVDVTPEMIGHCLGEFSLTRERVTHSGPGIGATRGTKFISVK